MKVLPARGWNTGEKPVVPAGLQVDALGTGFKHPRIVYPLPNFPQLVLEASEDTLRALGASPHVLRIQEPGLSRPTS